MSVVGCRRPASGVRSLELEVWSLELFFPSFTSSFGGLFGLVYIAWRLTLFQHCEVSSSRKGGYFLSLEVSLSFRAWEGRFLQQEETLSSLFSMGGPLSCCGGSVFKVRWIIVFDIH